MKPWFACVFFFFVPAQNLRAQSVLYSSFAGNPATTHVDVIGQAGNFYWVQKSKISSFRKRSTTPAHSNEIFDVYDEHLHRVNTISCAISDTVLKQYLVAGLHSFDQLFFTKAPDKTCVLLNRFSPDGTPLAYNDTLLQFPGSMKGDDFLVARSQDKTKLLLLGFEPVEDAPPHVHAVLYDTNWNVLVDTVYKKSSISQPYLQYDFTEYPLEGYDNSPVKVANNGDWLLAVPSRRSINYVLWHFQIADSTVTQNEVKLTQRSGVQTVSLSLDNAKGEACAGILLNTSAAAIKKVRIAHYVLSQCHLDFDTTYRFSTLAAGKTKEENLFEQTFMVVPGKGFMFLKEYGRPFVSTFPDEQPLMNDDEEAPTATGPSLPAAFNKNDYTRYATLSNAPRAHGRGDLNMYYFPAAKEDSCWSGLINQKQTAELNSSFLSYACVPLHGKIMLLYNSLSRNETKAATTTALDAAGHALDEGVVFWRFNTVFDFQKARQITATELAVPYEKNGGWGFAIIRL